MIPIPNEFKGTRDQNHPTEGAYHFKLVKREGQVALFEKNNPKHASASILYEVVVLRSEPERAFPDGRKVPAHERMPSPEEWGTYGWSPATLERALQIFDRECEQQLKGSSA